MKLTDALEHATALDDPRVDVGKVALVTLRFTSDHALDRELLQHCVVESFRAAAPKAAVKKLDAAGG